MIEIKPDVLFVALRLLTTPNIDKDEKASAVHFTQDSEGPENSEENYRVIEFNKVLSQNLAAFEESLQSDKSFSNLWLRLEELSSTSMDICWGEASCCWKTVTYCVQLLELLAESLASVQSDLTDTKSPKPPAEVLSVNQQKSILTTIQFIVCLGIGPCLKPGVGLPMELRSELGQVVSIATETEKSQEEKKYRLLFCLRGLLTCVKVTSLSAIVLSRHLTDILAVLLQLSFTIPKRVPSRGNNSQKPLQPSEVNVVNQAPSEGNNHLENDQVSGNESKKTEINADNKPDGKNPTEATYSSDVFTEADRNWCREELDKLLDRVYPPVLVRELLVLQGGPSSQMMKQLHEETRNKSVNSKPKPPLLVPAPPWLRKGCGQILTKILLKPHGVQHILRGMLQISTDPSSTLDWRKCEAVAKVIANCPSQMSSPEVYFKHIASQVLELLHFPDKRLSAQFSRVGCHVIYLISNQHPSLADKLFIESIVHPLRLSIKPDKNLSPNTVMVDEEAVTHCLEDLHTILVVGVSPPSRLVQSVQSLLHPLFKLFCFLHNGVSHLRSVVFDLITTTFKSFDNNVGVTALKCLLFDEGEVISPESEFSAGPTGGVVLIKSQPLEIEIQPKDNVKVVCLVELLKTLQTEGLTGEFFLALLNELTKMIKSGCDKSSLTNQNPLKLDIPTNGETTLNQNILILSLLAEISETFGPSCLKSSGHILEFVKVTLERAIEVYSLTEEPETWVFENETLTMAMGLLTAILSGAMQVTDSDRETMKELSPLFVKLEQLHPDTTVQEMASDLRIAIATHGTVLSSLLSMKKDLISNVPKTTASNKPKIEVLSKCVEDCHATEPNDMASRNADNNMGTQASKLTQAVNEAQDKLIPIRGHGLILLKSLLESKDSEALNHQPAILKIFQENLSHSDSYVYLSAVNGLVAMATVDPDTVIQSLIDQFANFNQSDHSTSVELRMKIGECLVKASRNLGDLLPRYRDRLLAAILTGVKDKEPEIRASCLSNLGEVCKLLQFSLGPNVQEVLSCCGNFLKHDTDEEVRKAAGLVLTMTLQGVGKDAILVLGDVLREVYRLLKLCQGVEKNECVLLHVNLALQELDSIMRDFLFPKQILQKKIQVVKME